MWNSGNQETMGTRSRFPVHLTGDGQENKMFYYSCPTFRSSESRVRDFHVAVYVSSALFSSASGYVAGDINRYHKATWGSPLVRRPHCFNYSNSLDNYQVHQRNKDQCCSELRKRRGLTTEIWHPHKYGEKTGEILDELLQELNSSISSDKHRGIRPPTTSIEGLRTLSPILGTLPDQKLQNTWQSLHCACFKVKGAWVQAYFHDWDMNCHTPITVMPRELLQLTEADTESEVPAPWLLPASPPSAVPDLEQELMSSSACVPGHELQSVQPPAFLGIVTSSLNIETEPRPAPEATCHWCITPEHQLHEEKPGLMDFPPKLVAEQLTSVDVDLFKKLLPQQCLSSICSKRNEPGNEHLACTVHATITQFNDVSNCVITTFLGNACMMAQDRPWWWSTGSRWPRILAPAIHLTAPSLPSPGLSNLAELLFHACHHLCSAECLNSPTEEHMDQSFQSLTYIAVLSSGESWPLVCLALVQHEKGWVLAASNNRSPLTDRLWFSAFQGNEINHRKKNKECRFMTEIMLLQVAADHYNVEPKHPFRAWFQSGKWLSEEESYILSC
ncbi:unnamed protein product [Nyctereutes procyonoides]|uniref:(raccoon dog) hypothetical protein n=1 Tax=Nyctereutes procyonoides TaxID=34880 RepID=A0A811YQR4_NYCPR|nr:unnamed protein product [Nyctereutes procyonoides]